MSTQTCEFPRGSIRSLEVWKDRLVPNRQAEAMDTEGTRPRKWVTVSNDMIMARMDWDIMMHRIMMVLISQIDSRHDERFRLQRVRVRDIRDLAQVSQKSIHREAADAAAKLVRQPIEFWSNDKQDYEGYPIFATCKYRSREGIIEARFNDDARPYLLQLSKHFTQYRLRQAIPLSTPYAIRTYEVSKMIERPGKKRTRKIPVARFRKMFKLKDKYARHSDMRRRVVNPSVDEVNEKCDVDVECVDVRDGQTPVALKWIVTSRREVEKSSGTNVDPSSSWNQEEKDVAPYEVWMQQMDEEERRSVREKARRLATEAGFDPGNERTFEAGVEIKLAALHRERKSRDEKG